ncbi:MAG TPA: hypothetical protein PL123_12320 [Bacteroidales bacterium]|nr:hypothetical protein [Bacteroidales bacterium]
MNIPEKIKPAIPHLLAIVIFMTLSLAYFYPLLEGKVMHTNDGTVAQNAAKEINDYRAKYGEEALWTNSMFSGMPAYLISTLYKGNIMNFVNKVLHFLRHPASVIFLSMLGFYFLLLMFKSGPRLAIAGAIAYGFSTYIFFILSAGHNTKAQAIAYMAPMIGSIIYTYRYDAIKGALLATFFLTLEIIANHPQITYYALLCILLFILIELIYSIREKELVKFAKNSLILIIPLVLTIGMNFSSLYSTYEYGKYSTRSKSELGINDGNTTTGLDKDYITQWSYGIDETFTFLIPNFKGGACKPFDKNSETVTTLRKNNASQYVSQFQQYWGTQPWVDGPVYLGAIIVFLFVLGLLIVKGPEKWWLLSATILSIMLAWGKNFMPLTNLFLDYFPGYNKFRAVTTILVVAEFCIPFLGILALRDVFNGVLARKELIKKIQIAAGITGGITLIFILFPGLAGSFISPMEATIELPDWLSSTLVADRQKMLRSDAFRSLMLILMGTGVILAFIYDKLKKEYAILLLAVLFLGDMWLVDKRYLNTSQFVRKEAKAKMQTPSAADEFILKDKSHYRVLNLTVSTFNDASTSYFHKSIGGYHGAKLKRYQELIDTSLSMNIGLIQTIGSSAKTIEDFESAFNGTSALNMLNTKYVIYNPDAPPLVNNKAYGNAWFVETPQIVENAAEEISGINKTDLSKVALIDRKFCELLSKPSYPVQPGDTISLVSYKPNRLVYTASSKSGNLAVFSEIYYPAGWKCFIDGKESDYFRADYVLRGIIVPEGSHEIEFRFEPSSYINGNRISYASSGIFILLIAGYVVMNLRKKKTS